MDAAGDFLRFIWEDIWTIIGLIFLYMNWKPISDTFSKFIKTVDTIPEYAQVALIVLLFYMVITDPPPYSYEKWVAIAGAVAAIAGIQLHSGKKDT